MLHKLISIAGLCALSLVQPLDPAVAEAGGGIGENGRIEGRYKFVPIPYVNYNRSFGFTIGAVPMVMFNPVERDTISPSSLVGLVGMYASNGTWFGLGFAQMFFKEDTWRATAAGGRGSVNFQFYLDNPINVWVPYNTRADFAYVEGQRKIVENVYAGLSYVYMHFRTSTEQFPSSENTTLNGIGVKGTVDRRSNVYYPKSGQFTNLQWFTYPTGLGNDVESNKIDIDYNHYWPFRQDKDVLAARGFAGLGIGDLSFNQQYIVGQVDIRGYTQGEFRGNYLVAAQGEYRWNSRGRWGAVGFLGLATVFDGINESNNGRILPGIGAGIRFTAFTDNHMNVGMDVAAGDGDWGIYFRIGEAF